MARSKKAAPLFRNPPPGMNPDGSPILKSPEDLEMEAEERRLLEQIELPFLHGWKWYPWAAAFRDSTNQVNLLCAANQISKSSTQIRKCIIWATDQTLWPSLWANKPIQFWYLYPTQKQVNAEFETKWKQFLPRGSMIDDPYYGYKVERKHGDIVAIHFHSGVHVYFKTYSQNTAALQTGTCDAIFCDEELPEEHFDELMLRISASSGYFHMVFTATLGQDYWRRAMEPEEGDEEALPEAFKQTVSLYDAMFYDDGTPSHWTVEKIKKIEARCSTQSEVLKRVFGKFIVIGGRKYESFNMKRHVKTKHPLPEGWLIYAGADIGGGGTVGSNSQQKIKSRAHKSALVYVAVSPDFRKGRAFLGWEGPEGQITTSGDVVEKHIEIVKENKLNITAQYYDWAAADFGKIAVRMGTPFEMAEKKHEIGEDVINTLFKNDMMYLYDDPELMKLAAQLASLKKGDNKRSAKDDIADAFRYAVTKIPWDWTFLTGDKPEDFVEPEEPMTEMQREVAERRKAFEQSNQDETNRIEDEFNEWNDYYEGN